VCGRKVLELACRFAHPKRAVLHRWRHGGCSGPFCASVACESWPCRPIQPGPDQATHHHQSWPGSGATPEVGVRGNAGGGPPAQECLVPQGLQTPGRLGSIVGSGLSSAVLPLSPCHTALAFSLWPGWILFEASVSAVLRALCLAYASCVLSNAS
jgi:hypothetical protein